MEPQNLCGFRSADSAYPEHPEPRRKGRKAAKKEKPETPEERKRRLRSEELYSARRIVDSRAEYLAGSLIVSWAERELTFAKKVRS